MVLTTIQPKNFFAPVESFTQIFLISKSVLEKFMKVSTFLENSRDKATSAWKMDIIWQH